MAAYSIAKQADRAKYGIRITQRDGTTGWIVGTDGDGLFFDDKWQMGYVLKSLFSLAETDQL